MTGSLRETLRATLIKNLRHESAFDTAFDVYFATVPQQLPEPNGPGEHRHRHGDRPDLDEPPPFDLDGCSNRSSRRWPVSTTRRSGVAPAPPSTSWPGMEPGRPVGGTYYLYRTLRRLDLADLEERLTSALTDDQDLSEFDRRLLRGGGSQDRAAP